MLVLTRKPQQNVFIGNDIEVRVLSVNRNQVRLGFSAPREIDIFREECCSKLRNKKHSTENEVTIVLDEQ